MNSGEEVGLLTLQEVIGLAVRNEERGSAFYTSLAKKAGEERTRQIFRTLAEEEREHARAFAAIGSEIAAGEPLDKNARVYVGAITKRCVFPSPESKRYEGGAQEALAIAIQAEKDSILLYYQLSESTHLEDSARQLIARLLKAEKLHLVELRDLEEDLDR